MYEKGEKRSMERFSLELPAQVFVIGENRDQDIIDLLTSNICAGGAFFHTDQPLPVGAEVRIDLLLPLDELKKLEGRRAHIKVSGTVIRSEGKGMAICFDEDYEISPARDRETRQKNWPTGTYYFKDKEESKNSHRRNRRSTGRRE